VRGKNFTLFFIALIGLAVAARQALKPLPYLEKKLTGE
jgi:hypothetical protein